MELGEDGGAIPAVDSPGYKNSSSCAADLVLATPPPVQPVTLLQGWLPSRTLLHLWHSQIIFQYQFSIYHIFSHIAQLFPKKKQLLEIRGYIICKKYGKSGFCSLVGKTKSWQWFTMNRLSSPAAATQLSWQKKRFFFLILRFRSEVWIICWDICEKIWYILAKI